MRAPLLGLLLSAATAAALAQGLTIDPEFRALQPPPRTGLDLAPAPPTPPPSMAEGQRSRLFPNLVIEPIVPGEDRRLPVSDLFGDGHSIIYSGDVMEDPARDRRIGGAATIPF
jgi:hypothetical protein